MSIVGDTPSRPGAPLGIEKFNTASEDVPLFSTEASSLYDTVVTLPIATVAASP